MIIIFSNKLSEYGKTQQHVKESADSTKKALQGHLMHAKETILRNLDHQYERLCTSVDETVKKDIENLVELEEHLKKEIENLNNILASGITFCFVFYSFSSVFHFLVFINF